MTKAYSTSFIKLCELCNEWSEDELSLVLEFLERDRSFSVDEISESMYSKTKTEILLQSTKYCTTETFDFSAALLESLEMLQKQEPVSHPKFRQELILSYPQMYKFLASITGCCSFPTLSDFSSAAILDLLTCLVRLLNIINGHKSKSSSLPNELHSKLTELWKSSSVMICDKIGIYLALATGAHLLSQLYCRRARIGTLDANDQVLMGPLFFASLIQKPHGLKQTRCLVEHLIGQFKETWSLPKCSDVDLYNEDDVDTVRIPKFVTKRLAMFSLNPFAFPIHRIEPFQTLVKQFIELCCSRMPYLNRFRSLSFSVPRPTNTNPDAPTAGSKRSKSKAKSGQAKRRRPNSNNNLNQANRESTDLVLGQDEGVATDRTPVVASPGSVENKIEPVRLSAMDQHLYQNSKRSTPKPCFVRISNPEEDKIVSRIVNKCVQVKSEKKSCVHPGQNKKS